MAQNETWLNHDMMGAVHVQYLDGNVFSQDNAGNLIGVYLTKGGTAYSGGGTVAANVIRADGATVAVSGALSGNAATVVLPQAAYAVPGVLSIIIKLTVNSEVTTIAALVANVYQSSTDSTVDPGTVIPSIETLIAAIDAAVASIPADYSSLWTSIAPVFSANGSYTAGQYVTYDGGFYKFITTHSGAWSASDVIAVNVGGELSMIGNAIFTTPSMTSGGFIRPYTPGEVVAHARSSYSDYIHFSGDAKVYTYLLENSTGICVYDENKNFLQAYTGDGAAWYSISVKNGRYFRLTNDHVYMKDENVKYVLDIGDGLIDALDFENKFLYMPSMTSGGFVKPWSPGDIVSHARSSYSGYIPIVGKVKVYTYLIDGTSIGVYDKNKNYLRSITGNGAAWYDITTNNGAYFRITNDHLSMSDYSVRCFYASGNPFVTPSLTSGGFVKPWSPGDIVEHARSSYSDYIAFDGTGDVYTWLIDNTGIAVYDSGKNFIRAITGSGAEWYNITTQGGAYFRLTNDHVNMADSEVKYCIDTDGNEQDKSEPNFLSIYNKIVCCGDSITWGAVYTAASTVRQAYKPYPAVLQSLTGTETQNLGASGDSASDWWHRYNDKLEQDALYIVFLGTNGGLTDTISTDCPGTDPLHFSDTNTGNYGKILQRIKNLGKKAVLIHVYAASGSTVAITNSVINQFGQRFSFPVIELGSERTMPIYHYYPDGTGSNVVHFNDYGYCWEANEINNLVNNLPDADKLNIFPA